MEGPEPEDAVRRLVSGEPHRAIAPVRRRRPRRELGAQPCPYLNLHLVTDEGQPAAHGPRRHQGRALLGDT